MHLADAFIQSDLQCIQAIHVFLSIWYVQGLSKHALVSLKLCHSFDFFHNFSSHVSAFIEIIERSTCRNKERWQERKKKEVGEERESKSSLYYSLGQAHEKFNQAMQITASAQNKHIPAYKSIFQLVFMYLTGRASENAWNCFCEKSAEDLAS